MRRKAAIVSFLGAIAASLTLAVAPASADPIVCPGNLTAVHLGGSDWVCETQNGHITGAGKHQGD